MKIKRTRIEITKSNLLNKRPFHHVDLPRKTPVILAGNSRLVPQMGQLSHRLTFSLQHNFFGYQVFVVFQSTTAEIMTDKIAPNMATPRANSHHFVFSNFVPDLFHPSTSFQSTCSCEIELFLNDLCQILNLLH